MNSVSFGNAVLRPEFAQTRRTRSPASRFPLQNLLCRLFLSLPLSLSLSYLDCDRLLV